MGIGNFLNRLDDLRKTVIQEMIRDMGRQGD